MNMVLIKTVFYLSSPYTSNHLFSFTSKSDKEITRQLKKAGDLLWINVLDHVIIGEGKYYSFADKGEL